MKRNILVFPCGSEIGLEVYRSLNLSTHFNIYGASSVDDHGKFIYKNYIDNIPDVDDPTFIGAINDIAEKESIEFIIPAHDSVLLKLAQAKTKGDLKCGLLTSPLKTCEITRSKLKTYEVFKSIVPTPKIYTAGSLNDEDLPIFLKPEVGQGSKGTHVANNQEEIIFYTKRDPTLLLLEYLPGKEYTIDCFTSKEGELLLCEGRERSRTQNGISVNAFSVDDGRFRDLGEKINETLEFRGVWFFQVKEGADKQLVLLEIAPRVAGTMALIRSKGVNLVLLSLFDALGYEVDVAENNYSLVLDRALENKYRHNINYQHVYLDFDDLVILDGKVNPAIMAFVYQCLNKEVKLHLLTRHKENLEESLKKYRLNDIFDELILLKDGEEKHDKIKERDAIFIDDSFTERKKVYEMNSIPVFDSHMIEALMEKD